MLVLGLACATLAARDTTTIAADSLPTSSVRPHRFGVSALAMLRAPVGSFAERWRQFPSAGLTLSLPTPLRALDIVVGGQAGTMHSTDEQAALLVIELSLYTSFNTPVFARVLQIRPIVGLASTAVFASEAFEPDWHPFATSESEFGLLAGVEPSVRLRAWRLSVPLQVVWVFCAPNAFVHLDAGVRIGREF